MTYLIAADLIKILESKRGTRPYTALANDIGISPQLLGLVILGQRSPGREILRYLGFTRHVVYAKVAK